MRLAPFFLALVLPLAAAAATAPKPARPVLDTLFDQLKQADSPDTAKPIEQHILGIFAQPESATIELLITRANAAAQAGEKDAARQLFEAITTIAPNYAEGWHARANLQRANNDDAGAMASLEHVVVLNPRQFAALYELGTILEDYGNKAGALAFYRRALALDPQLEGAQKHVDALSRDVEGQGI